MRKRAPGGCYRCRTPTPLHEGSSVITYEELITIADEDRRVHAAQTQGPVLYRFGDSTHRGMGLNLGGPVETDNMRCGAVMCTFCELSWEARRPSFFSGLACPRCDILCGQPPEDLIGEGGG